MKAIICGELGGPDALTLGELPVPKPGPGEVRIAVHAAGVNFADTLMIQGKYQVKPALPFAPGMEAAGVVSELGPGTQRLKVGDRVMALVGHGAFAEEAVLPEDLAIPMPDGLDMRTAASFAVTYGTSHIALEHRGQLKAGETLLVHGAAGGVGLSAVEIGKKMGARVIATAGGKDKVEIALRHGADIGIDYSVEDFKDRVKAATGGRGADVIYDPVGGDVFDASLRSIAWGGRILVIGFAAGRIPQIPANILLMKNVAAVGVHWAAYRLNDLATLRASFEQLFRWQREGAFKPLVSKVYTLAETPEALKAIAARKTTGKVVIDLR
jgi:NADPH2:quinone reductase